LIKRVITALIGAPLTIVLCVWAPMWLVGAVIGVLCALATVEFMRCVNSRARLHRRAVLWPMISAFAMPFWLSVRGEGASLYTLSYYLFFTLFLEYIISYERKDEKMDLPLILAGLVSGMVMPIMLSSLVRIGLRVHGGRLNMLLPFIIAFSCDTGAFLTGKSIGRHKLVPRLSPNKTVEGAIGGLLFATLGSLIYGGILTACGFEVNYFRLTVYSFCGGIACELGDLSFSAVKRFCGVKDYGNILPGHGGILDRFDSMYFTAPLLEILTFWLPAIIV